VKLVTSACILDKAAHAPASGGRPALPPGIYVRGELPQPAPKRPLTAKSALAAPSAKLVRRPVANEGGDEEEEDYEEDEEAVASAPKRRKDAPAELPSNRGVARFRQTVPVTRVERRDPRFDAACGTFDATKHEEAYAFVSDLRAAEEAELRGALKRARNSAEANELESELRARKVAAKVAARAKADAETRRASKKVIAEAVAAGGAVFFPKKRDLRQLEAVEQFKKLTAKGGLGAVERTISKKRAKLSHKDKRNLPLDMRGRE
jgi:hypothetical protein